MEQNEHLLMAKTSENLATDLGIEKVDDIKNWPYVRDHIQKIPYHFAKLHIILPIGEENGRVVVAVCDLLNLQATEEVRLFLNQETTTMFCPKALLEGAIESCYQQKDGETKSLFSEMGKDKKTKESKEQSEVYDLLDRSEENPIVRMLNTILREAIGQQASDIHFEPHEGGMQLRYRIDGVLQKRHAPPFEYQPQILTRIKVMAKLDIAEQRLPQDGRIKLKLGQREIDFRVSTIPVIYGERTVLRILDTSSVVLGLEKTGMPQAILKDFRKTISTPEGIILVTGPTGSGKTTTLYSAISDIYSESINIMTIEDPVEYKLSNIAQIGVNPKIQLDFARGLRHILRQDPDAIMIGEIRDKETAEIAIQAALTGHLVLSTLHTNDAPSAITRLVDMGIESYLLSSSIIGVLAQRLVRKICPHCISPYSPSEEELLGLKITMDDLPEKKLYKGMGCEKCFHTGYKGRLGIYEFMRMTPLIKAQVAKSIDAEKLRTIFHKEKMIDLHTSGVQLVLDKKTTPSEIFRVTGIGFEATEE